MQFSDIVTEVYNRGFHYLNDGSTQTARVKRWVNEAYHEICEDADWPFLEVTASGAAPLSLTRARNIESVVNTTDGVELDWAPRRYLVDIYGTIPAGTPKYWYVEHAATDTLTVNVAPTAGDTLSVRFFQHQADLSSDSDVPVVPARFHWLIVEGAVRRAYADSDQYAEAQAVEAYRQQGMLGMKGTLLRQGKPSPNKVMVTEQDQMTEQGQRVVKGGEM